MNLTKYCTVPVFNENNHNSTNVQDQGGDALPQLPPDRDGGDGLLPGAGVVTCDINNETMTMLPSLITIYPRTGVLSAIECHLANQPRGKTQYKV